MLYIALNNEHHKLDFYQLDFTNDLPNKKITNSNIIR